MKIDQLLQGTTSKNLKEQSPVEKAKDGASKTGSGKSAGGALKIDTVTISDEARNLQRSIGETRTEQKQTNAVDIRQGKVQAAKAGIADGSLLSDEVVEKTAEAILESGDLGDIIDSRKLSAGVGRSGVEDIQGADAGRIDEIRQRIQSGYYNSADVVDNIAEKMLDDLLA